MKSKNNKKYKWKTIIDPATNLLIKNGFQIAYCTDRRYIKRYIRKCLIARPRDKRFCYNYKISRCGYIKISNNKTIVWFIVTYKPNNDGQTYTESIYYHENNETNLFTVNKNN